jgi:hypothetical protein
VCSEGGTVLDVFFSCWCLETRSDNRIRHVPRYVDLWVTVHGADRARDAYASGTKDVHTRVAAISTNSHEVVCGKIIASGRLPKLAPTVADRGCRVVSVSDPNGRNLGFLDRSRYFFSRVASHSLITNNSVSLVRERTIPT